MERMKSCSLEQLIREGLDLETTDWSLVLIPSPLGAESRVMLHRGDFDTDEEMG